MNINLQATGIMVNNLYKGNKVEINFFEPGSRISMILLLRRTLVRLVHYAA